MKQQNPASPPTSHTSMGTTRWAVAEGYLPPGSTGSSRQLTSHEALCVLNSGGADAHLEITLFFTDREPVGPYCFTVPARRTRHLRFNDFDDPETIPEDTDFASLIVSDVPVVIQHSRLDSRQAELALLSTMAFPG